MTRWQLTTHYVGAHHPTVLCFGTKAEAEAFAAREIATYTGVSRVVIRPLTEADEEDDNLAGPRGISNALHIVGAVVASGWFVARLIEVMS
jgi:hypothetical protein